MVAPSLHSSPQEGEAGRPLISSPLSSIIKMTVFQDSQAYTKKKNQNQSKTAARKQQKLHTKTTHLAWAPVAQGFISAPRGQKHVDLSEFKCSPYQTSQGYAVQPSTSKNKQGTKKRGGSLHVLTDAVSCPRASGGKCFQPFIFTFPDLLLPSSWF